ncbi:SGNH/GDSL hydrolase family protein [Streptomyces mirabilis]|uniref:hypothetical protein n=1 Tax=Streptomyces mirabilis TaxID=68239 RepID=UPI0036AF57A9
MALSPRKAYQSPDFWSVFGHSYFQYSFGTYYQTGRSDGLLRGSLNIDFANFRNFAIAGSRLTNQGASTGGFEMFFNHSRRPQRGGPYSADGGAAMLCWGINDMGLTGVDSQTKGAFQQALRTAISRWRASVIFEDDFLVGTRTSYGAGFGAVAATDYTSNNTAHWATSTTNANFTLTLPSDYNGEPVSICLVGAGGVSGGTVTWSGTAGVTGTTSTSNIIGAAALTHVPIVKRITNLTSANAGQTIIGTVTALDAGGAVMLDCWWLEAKDPQPVIVCNIARLTASGYTSNYPSWSGTEATRDADVNTWNTAITSIVNEFDSMVQIADMDSALNKNTAYFASDGLHPNELGAALIVDAIYDARGRLVPTSTSASRNLNPSSPRIGQTGMPHLNGQWYTAEYLQTTTYTPVVGDLFALPLWITGSRERLTRLALEMAAGATAAGSIRWGVYSDVEMSGYPQELVNEPTGSSGALSTGTVAGAVMSPTSGSGSINVIPDPSLYWLAFLVVTAGTGVSLRALQGANNVLPNVASTGLPFQTIGAGSMGWKLTGQGTTALPTNFPSGAALASAAPYVGAQVTINATN